MASGFGPTGGRSRCYPQWQETHKCYAMTDNPKECVLQLEDYFECLHHNKEIARLEKIKKQELKLLAEKKKRQQDAQRNGLIDQNEIIQLGLVQGTRKPEVRPSNDGI